jgi:hypothetical protein
MWWQDAVAVRQGDLVTFRHVGFSDNTRAWVGRVFGPAVGAFLSPSDPADPTAVRDLVLGYLRGFSALFEGSPTWGDMHVRSTTCGRCCPRRYGAPSPSSWCRPRRTTPPGTAPGVQAESFSPRSDIPMSYWQELFDR